MLGEWWSASGGSRTDITDAMIRLRQALVSDRSRWQRTIGLIDTYVGSLVKVDFDRIAIGGDCDQLTDFDGEFFYRFWVDGVTVAELMRDEAIGLGNSDEHVIEESETFEYPWSSSRSLVVGGEIFEKDRVTSGRDDLVGQAERTHSLNDQELENTYLLDFYNSRDCNAQLHYTLTRLPPMQGE